MKKWTFENCGADAEKARLVTPDYLFNRFDILYGDDYAVIKTQEDEKDIYIPIHVRNDEIELGLQLTEIGDELVRALLKYLYKAYPRVRRIRFSNTRCRTAVGQESTFYVMKFPDTAEALDAGMTANGRKHLRRKIKRFNEQVGPYVVKHYTADDVPDDVIHWYFNTKSDTYHTPYEGMTARQYLAKYHVTDVYAMAVNDEMCAIRLTAEQCDAINAENHTYDRKYFEYSPGILLYYEFLKLKISEKKHRYIFLGGGDYDNKKEFSSIAVTVFNGVSYRSAFTRLSDKLKARMGKA